jgi:3-deoxy-7-phosphoheptulonate synthase
MANRVDDIRIQDMRPLLPPAILMEEVPQTDATEAFVVDSRKKIKAVVSGEDDRLLAVVGPCSVHNVEAAKEYAEKLKGLNERYQDSLVLVMRAYFEKPRTVIGWKGLINDPDLDESFHINKGLRLARRLLFDLAEMQIPAGCEFLDMTVPQHIADLVSWGAIGARTSESQTHRELASGLSMPVGFKNSTDGSFKNAVDAVRSAASSHWFPSSTKQGVSAIFQTTGNDGCHVILRGGSKTGPNYMPGHVKEVAQMLEKLNLPPRVMIDCSHGNSGKDHTRQAFVAEDVAWQVRNGSKNILGVMIESFLVEGRQDYVVGEEPTYGQSITDSCVSLEQTVPILDTLAEAVQSARSKA